MDRLHVLRFDAGLAGTQRRAIRARGVDRPMRDAGARDRSERRVRQGPGSRQPDVAGIGQRMGIPGACRRAGGGSGREGDFQLRDPRHVRDGRSPRGSCAGSAARIDSAATVEPGAGRGQTIGFRTINLAGPPPEKALPPDGVYAALVEWGGGTAGAMLNQGTRPTVGDQRRTIEAHLFDFEGNLYGRVVRIEWVERLTGDQALRIPRRLAAPARAGPGAGLRDSGTTPGDFNGPSRGAMSDHVWNHS